MHAHRGELPRVRRSDLRADLFLDTSIADFKELPTGRMNLDLTKGTPTKLSPATHPLSLHDALPIWLARLTPKIWPP